MPREKDKKLMKRIGLNIRVHRLAKGITMKELSKASGLSLTHIGNVERARFSPTIEVMIRIAQGLNVNINELVSTEDICPVNFNSEKK